MKLVKLNLMDQSEIAFMQNLYIKSFPKEERRPTDKMFKLYEENKDTFVILLAVKDNQRVGFFTYWDFKGFIYAEHFAISANFRSSGYGSKVIDLFMKKISKPIILEVEPPTSHWEERRIVFYERLGFKIWNDIEYKQPSYHQDGKTYPMKLMTVGDIDLTKDGDKIINLIHTIAYNS